ncbi:CHAD domain-containing protein [Rhodococcus sp. NPDC058521]|uniref:CYTH and CHAD domain-containing protein n=1 Tax=Rhodococcus sp. NPDC058521 TaxID=3346536 RepID=UPI00365F4278
MSRTNQPMAKPRAFEEVERKYETTGDNRFPSLSGLPGVAGESIVDNFSLSALYYDTEDHRLLDSAITLRRREGGDDAGWHLKLPVSEDSRMELHLPDSVGTEEAPAALAGLLAAVTGGAELTPLALVGTDRERHRLHDSAGRVLVEVVLDLVVAAVPESDRDGNVWREVEVEQIAGDTGLLDSVEARLLASGMTRSAYPSKLHRAVGSLSRVSTVKHSSSDPRAALSVYLGTQTRAMQLADIALRRDLPGAVHDLRVAARRLRSALRVHGDTIDDHALVDTAIEDLRWVGRRLGEVRDVEVQRERLVALAGTTADVPDRAEVAGVIEPYFDELAARARQVATDTMSSARYLNVFDTLAALRANLESSGADRKRSDRRAARENAYGAVAHLARKVNSRLRAASKEGDPTKRGELLHHARKGVKRLRYAVEVLEPLRTGKTNRAVHGYKGLQELLGEHQDSMVARRHLVAMTSGTDRSASIGFGLGLMYAREVARGDGDKSELSRSWKKARKATRELTE